MPTKEQGDGFMYWVLSSLCFLGILFYLTCVLPTRWLKVERITLPLNLGIKIVQISDIHIERNRIRPNVLAQIIARENPNLICLTGDFLDKASSFIQLTPFLKMIQSSGIPAYAVLGNHDYRLKRPEDLRRLLREFGITVLVNEAVIFDKLNLVGIDDFCTHHSDERAFTGILPNQPTIVITHDPTIVLSMKNHFDYLFAGHLHGKQFAVPFLFWLKDMGPLAKSGVYQGLHDSENGTYYISKGVGQSGINLRFLVRSEITVHEL